MLLKLVLFIFTFSSSLLALDRYNHKLSDELTKQRSHKRLQSKLALGVSLLTNLHMYSVIDDVNSKAGRYSDKDGHFAGGFIIGSLSSAAAQVFLPSSTKNKKLKAFLVGVGLSTLAGIAKEGIDSTGRGTVEFEDALATTLGGISGSIVISFSDLEKLF